MDTELATILDRIFIGHNIGATFAFGVECTYLLVSKAISIDLILYETRQKDKNDNEIINR
jgi:hypothetical protein